MMKPEDTGATYRQLDHWARKGYLHTESVGTGHKRQWAYGELMVARRMVQLIAVGFNPKEAARYARLMVKAEYTVDTDTRYGVTVTVNDHSLRIGVL